MYNAEELLEEVVAKYVMAPDEISFWVAPVGDCSAGLLWAMHNEEPQLACVVSDLDDGIEAPEWPWLYIGDERVHHYKTLDSILPAVANMVVFMQGPAHLEEGNRRLVANGIVPEVS